MGHAGLTLHRLGQMCGRQNREHASCHQAMTQSTASRVRLHCKTSTGDPVPCGVQETRLTEAGQAWAHEAMKVKEWNIFDGLPLEVLRSAWEACTGGVAIAAGPGVEMQRAPLTTPQAKALNATGRLRQSCRCISSHCMFFRRWGQFREHATQRTAVQRYFLMLVRTSCCAHHALCRSQGFSTSL